MTDMEDILKSRGGPKPKRGLSKDFTRKVLVAVSEPPKKKREWWQRYLSITLLRLPKPIVAILVMVALAAVGGSAYAVVTNWPDTSAKLRDSKLLASGNRVVTVDTENCLAFENLDGTAKADGKRTVYYEIRKESSLTDEQALNMIRANCEENISNNALSAIIKELYGEISKGSSSPKIMSGSGMLIKAIDDESITLGYDPTWFGNPDMSAFTRDITYTRISKDVAVYDRGRPISFSNLRPGDSVKVVVRDDHKLGSEVDPNDPNHWDDPDLIVIEAILRVPATSAPPTLFYQDLATNFVRVEPCDISPSGFCRAYEFTKDDFTKGTRLEP